MTHNCTLLIKINNLAICLDIYLINKSYDENAVEFMILPKQAPLLHAATRQHSLHYTLQPPKAAAGSLYEEMEWWVATGGEGLMDERKSHTLGSFQYLSCLLSAWWVMLPISGLSVNSINNVGVNKAFIKL